MGLLVTRYEIVYLRTRCFCRVFFSRGLPGGFHLVREEVEGLL